MPIPPDNSYFQRGDFSGFSTCGRCSVATSFRPWAATGSAITPIRGSFLAIIDDPWAIDLTDGHRIDPATGQRLPRPTDPDFDAAKAAQDAVAGRGPVSTERIDYEYRDGDGRITVGADGAWLDCADVEIKPGERLWFHWRFCRFGSMPFNDFALFLAYADGDTSAPAVHRQILCDVWSLEESRPSSLMSPWTVGVFAPAAGFKGALRWMASNGQSLARVRAKPSPKRFDRPSALLLDNLSIE